MPGLASPPWPSSRDFVEAIQNPQTSLSDSALRDYSPVLDRLGMPLVSSGNFAYVFKLKHPTSDRVIGIRCFRSFLHDREARYLAIDDHLDSTPASALASFEYDPDGIRVQGRTFPIVVMEWLRGPTLDLYVEQVLGNPAALKHLANEWLRVFEQLRKASVGHGDLQHGNVLVVGSGIRIIDLDGMFVPKMQGWRSSELGHQHFQHPARDATFFDSRIDHFSALVIYTSLLVLSEAPELWRQFHDENLIFTKSDFVDPGASPLFRATRAMSGDTKRFVNALIAACSRSAFDTPSLLDLAKPASRLPSWMTAPLDVRVDLKTRESPQDHTANTARSTTTPSGVTVGSGGVVPQRTASTPTVAAPVASPANLATVGAPASQWQDLRQFGQMIGKYWFKTAAWGLLFFFLWVPLATSIAEAIGLGTGEAPIFLVYVGGCFGLAFVLALAVRSSERQRLAQPTTTPPAAARMNSPQPPANPPSVPHSRRQQSPRPPQTAAQTAYPAAPVVASRIRATYHRPTCEWVRKMSSRNRMTFTSATHARGAGYRACRTCNP